MNQRVTMLLAMLTLLSLVTFQGAKAAPQDCNGRKYTWIMDRPLSNEVGSDNFRYSFKYKCIGPTYPTIIYLPGGPGAPSSDFPPEITAEANLIFTDARGTGINENFWDQGGKAEDVSSETLAEDIMAIVDQFHLKKYVLYGHSYGTLLATITAHKIEASDLPRPLAVVLEGPTGRYIEGSEQLVATNKALKFLADNSRSCIACKLDELKEKYSTKTVGGLIEALLGYGGNLNLLERALTGNLADQIPYYMSQMAKPVSTGRLKLYNSIACDELTTLGMTGAVYSKNDQGVPEIKYLPGGSCGGKPLRKPFSAADWQVQSKIYYFVGSQDISTPPELGEAHYESQTQKLNNDFVLTPMGGHFTLQYDLADCSQELWAKILKAENLGEILSRCKVGPTLLKNH